MGNPHDPIYLLDADFEPIDFGNGALDDLDYHRPDWGYIILARYDRV